MEEIPTLLTLDRLTKKDILDGANLTVEDGKFCFEVLSKVFNDLIIHPNREFLDMHSLERILLTLDSSGMRELFTFMVELEESMQIPNYEQVIKRFRDNDVGSYLSARGEVKAGAWMRNSLSDVQFVIPKSKKGKTADLKGTGTYGDLYVEVKSENQFDLSVGLNNMFKGWVRSHLSGLIPLKDCQLQISFGSYWVDAIGAACRINKNMQGAKWAFHSVVMAISSAAAQKIYNYRSQLIFERSLRIDPDIEIFMTHEFQNAEEQIIIKLPDSTKLATLGRIISSVTNPEYLGQASDQEFVFFYYAQESPDETMASTMLGNLFLQSPDLEQLCLGLVIANSENDKLVFICNDRGVISSPDNWERRRTILYSAFKKPTKLK